MCLSDRVRYIGGYRYPGQVPRMRMKVSRGLQDGRTCSARLIRFIQFVRSVRWIGHAQAASAEYDSYRRQRTTRNRPE